MLEFHLLTLELLLVTLPVLNSQFLEGVIIAFVVLQFLVVKVNYFVTCHVKELSSV